MRTPHKHAELIKAWADGAEIELRTICDDWICAGSSPTWNTEWQYRIKPQGPNYGRIACFAFHKTQVWDSVADEVIKAYRLYMEEASGKVK